MKYKILLIALAIALVSAGCAKPKDGEPGLPGERGPVGPQGPAGADGQLATVVKLCPGTTAYPAVFVEVALCINNGLYGVYSANGGFLTYFPPGNYSSAGIGSSCNLTVLPNCLVVN